MSSFNGSFHFGVVVVEDEGVIRVDAWLASAAEDHVVEQFAGRQTNFSADLHVLGGGL